MRFKNDPVMDGILCVTGNLIFFSMVCDPGSQNEVIGTGEVILIHHHHLFIHLILRTKKKKKTSLKPQAQMEERVHFLSMLWGTMSSFGNVKNDEIVCHWLLFSKFPALPHLSKSWPSWNFQYLSFCSLCYHALWY